MLVISVRWHQKLHIIQQFKGCFVTPVGGRKLNESFTQLILSKTLIHSGTNQVAAFIGVTELFTQPFSSKTTDSFKKETSTLFHE